MGGASDAGGLAEELDEDEELAGAEEEDDDELDDDGGGFDEEGEGDGTVEGAGRDDELAGACFSGALDDVGAAGEPAHPATTIAATSSNATFMGRGPRGLRLGFAVIGLAT